jgi:hypothetical protein
VLACHGAVAEGAVRQLDCRVAQVCDGAGRCRAGTGNIAFTIAPVSLAAGGAGRYTVDYGDVRAAAAEAWSDAGPFFWLVGSERNTLVASSETEWLWHRLSIEPAPRATVSFLSCWLRG